MQSSSRPGLLVVELWGLGDLALAVPFLREAARHADVTLVAKPQWAPLMAAFCSEVELIPFSSPWTVFTAKYRLYSWPWRTLAGLVKTLRKRRFDIGMSARADPRDHLLLRLAGVQRCVGIPRAGSGVLLSTRLAKGRTLHRAAVWRQLAATQGWAMPAPITRRLRPPWPGALIVVHSGASQPTRIWPLERFAELVRRLRNTGRAVQVLCDPGQVPAWHKLGEAVTVPENLSVLLEALAAATLFVGNDSGPGHVAALCGVPTFTVFGPTLVHIFSPAHPAAAWIEGRPCRYKPCFDACRYDTPRCIEGISVDEVWSAVALWIATAR